jgi:serine/threonine-protein kinase
VHPEKTELPLASDASEHETRVGELLGGKYELLRKVGEGGMGEVYEARHTQLGRRFAVKLLHPELLSSKRMLRRFSREVLAVSQLENDHVVPALDCGYTADGGPYYVMEFLRGRDLRQLLREEAPLATQRAVRLVIDVCRGLSAAHRAGLVHRDLKPENVFVVRCDDGGEAGKVLDFGLVQLAGGSSTTHAGALVGTIRYMAPEQARGDQPVDQRADVYAVGAILYECLAGRPPHPGSSAEEVLFNRMNQPARSLGEQREGLPEGLEGVVQHALSSTPDERYQSALELATALVPFAGTPVAGLDTSYPLRTAELESVDGSTITCDMELPAPRPKTARFERRHWLGIAAVCAISGVLVGQSAERWLERRALQGVSSQRKPAVAFPPVISVAPAADSDPRRFSPALPAASARTALASVEAPRSAPSSTSNRNPSANRRLASPAGAGAAERPKVPTPTPTPDSYFDHVNPYTGSKGAE